MVEPKRTFKRRTKDPIERFLQDILFEETIMAIKIAQEVKSVPELIQRLRNELPQNSPNTRKRNTSIILGRFYPNNNVEEFPTLVLRHYKDETLLREVLKVLFPIKEPIIGDLIQHYLFPLQPGTELPQDFFVRFVKETYGKSNKKISTRCSSAASLLGWTHRDKGKNYVMQKLPDLTVFLLFLHYTYAPIPKIVEVRSVVKDGYWKYFGFRDFEDVRAIFQTFEAKQLISRYSVADRLEHITTKYSLEQLLKKGVRV